MSQNHQERVKTTQNKPKGDLKQAKTSQTSQKSQKES